MSMSSVVVPGTLSVASHKAVNGTQKIAMLHCSLGEFRANFASLAELEDGEYQGFYGIERIASKFYQHESKHFFELEATLDRITFDYHKRERGPEAKVVNHSPVIIQGDLLAAEEYEDDVVSLEEDHDDEALFCELWPLGESVQLDATLSRTKLNAQSDRLRELGYRFDVQNQLWHI